MNSALDVACDIPNDISNVAALYKIVIVFVVLGCPMLDNLRNKNINQPLPGQEEAVDHMV